MLALSISQRDAAVLLTAYRSDNFYQKMLLAVLPLSRIKLNISLADND